MFADIIEEIGESVTVVRLSADKDEESIIANEIMCVIQPVDDGKYENWKAELEANRDIRKGDILRREDESELQVMRAVTQSDPIVTQSGPIGGDITELDLKDYDRQDSPLEKSEVNASRSDFLSEHEFHPMIPQNVWSSFSQRAYGSAVFEAFKQVEIAVREAGGYAETDIGVKLMRKAFNVKKGDLTDQNQQESEKEARFFLFVGAIGAYKNPGSHRKVKMTAEEAIEMIALASLLLRIVDSRSWSEGDWQEQFANRFVRHLKDRESLLMDPEVFMGEDARGYPRYIGFNIGKIENLDLRDKDAFWLVASTIHDGKIYLKLHMNDSNCFNQLKSEKKEIERKFGEQLKWEHENKPHRIGVDLKVKPLDENRGQWNQHFEDMREKLEKLNEIFQSRIENLFFKDYIPSFSDDDIPF